MRTVVRFFGRCLLRLFLAMCNCLLAMVLMVAFYSLLFAFAVRGCTAIAPPKPSLDSFDPKLRVLAAEKAAEKYGGDE